MRIRIGIAVASLATVFAASQQPQPTPARLVTLATMPGVYFTSIDASTDGKFFYMTTGDSAVVVYNRGTKKTTVIARGAYTSVDISSTGRKLVLLRYAERPRTGRLMWTLAIDPRTGLATGAPMRVSATPALDVHISPDDRFIAFLADTSSNPNLNENRLVIVPTGGGIEKTILTKPPTQFSPQQVSSSPEGLTFSVVIFNSSLADAPHLWSADSKWIITRLDSQIVRIPVAGGAPEKVLTLPPSRGTMSLAPDGKGFAIRRTGVNSVPTIYEVFDSAGRSRGVVSMNVRAPGVSSTNHGSWFGLGLKMAAVQSILNDSMHVLEIGRNGARPKTVSSGLPNGVMSPDGKRIVAHRQFFQSGLRDATRLVLMNSDGKAMRVLDETDANLDRRFPPVWSPDGRYVAFRGARGQTLNVVNVESGKVQSLASSSFTLSDYRWSSNSQSILYAKDDGSMDRALASVNEVSLAGVDRPIRDLTPLLPAGSSRLYFVGDSAVLSVRYGLLLSLRGGSALRVFDSPTGGGTVTAEFLPLITPDGQWISVLASDRQAMRLFRADGNEQKPIVLPFALGASELIALSPDARNFAVPRAPRGDTLAAIYLVPTSGAKPSRVVALAKGQRVSDLRFSPDGRKVLYSVSTPASVLLEIDLGSALPKSTGRRGAEAPRH